MHQRKPAQVPIVPASVLAAHACLVDRGRVVMIIGTRQAGRVCKGPHNAFDGTIGNRLAFGGRRVLGLENRMVIGNHRLQLGLLVGTAEAP